MLVKCRLDLELLADTVAVSEMEVWSIGATVFVWLQVVEGPRDWWIGLSDLGHEGSWVWQHSGRPAQFTSWGVPPNSTTTANCAVLRKLTGTSIAERSSAAALICRKK